MTKKIMQVYLGEDIWAWITKSMKEMKIKNLSEFIRTVFAYLMETDSTELKTKIEKARISSMLQDAEARAEKAAKEKEQLERQLEKLNA